MHALGMTLASGKDGLAMDNVAAAEWFRRAADKGFADALHALGLAYVWGAGVPRSLEDAERCWISAKYLRHAPSRGSGCTGRRLRLRRWRLEGILHLQNLRLRRPRRRFRRPGRGRAWCDAYLNATPYLSPCRLLDP